jgi:SWI/SNF-related matrix-associated actin-dependent regulator of chromatin subfamily A member 5
MNKEKKDLAEKIRKENESFMKSIEQTKKDRLKFLLRQTEIFAHFLVGNKHLTVNEENTANNKSKGKTGSRKRNISSTKKENLSILKSIQESNDDLDDLEFESPQITRLLFQPSTLTGGKLTEYQINGLNWLINLYETGLNGILADEMVKKI